MTKNANNPNHKDEPQCEDPRLVLHEKNGEIVCEPEPGTNPSCAAELVQRVAVEGFRYAPKAVKK